MTKLFEEFLLNYTFWMIYILVGSFYPTYNIIIRKNYHITNKKIMASLLINSTFTYIVLCFTTHLPILIECDRIMRYLLFIIISDLWFYIIHRLMHTKLLYVFHKKHHEYVQPHALAGLYCSVVEMILANQLSVLLPLKLMNFTFLEKFFFMIIAAVSVLKGHSGLKYYESKLGNFFLSSKIHDIHHRTCRYNYGIMYLFDYIFGTYKN